MGVIKRGILGGFSGKVADIVGSSWKGIAVMKSRPLSVANPRTPAQTGQRDKFAGIVGVGSFLLTQIIKPLWDRFAQQQSGYNAFISANIATFVGSVFTNFADFIISRGSLVGAAISDVTAVNGAPNVVIAYPNNAGTGNAGASDEVYAVVYNATKDEWGQAGAESIRSNEEIEVVMPTNCVTGNLLKVYIAFRRPDGTIVSDTSFFAKTVTA